MAVPTDYTDEEIAAAIVEAGGYITGVAKILDCRPCNLSQYIKSRPELRDLQLDNLEEVLDNAERGLHKAIYAEKPWAIKFALSRLGRGRGYGQKIEVEGTGNSASRVVVYLPDDGREQPGAIDGDSTASGSTGCSTSIEG